jgi:hypothetical protein
MLNPVSILQLQAALATLEAALGDVKEYKEDWRKTPVLRQGGRFASSNPSSSSEQVNIKIKDFLTDAVIAAQSESIKFIDGLPPKEQAAVKKVIASPSFTRLKEGVEKLLPEVHRNAFDRAIDEIKDSRRPLKERIKKMGYVASKELEAARATLDLSLPKTVAGQVPGLKLLARSDINTFIAAVFGIPMMCAALNPFLEDEFAATDPEKSHRINLILRAVTAVGVAASIYTATGKLKDVHKKAGELIEEDDKQRFIKETTEFRDKLMQKLHEAVSVESGKHQLDILNSQLSSKVSAIKDFFAVSSVEEARTKLSGVLKGVNSSFRQGYDTTSAKINQLIHGTPPPPESEEKDNSKLKYIIAGSVIAAALAVGGAVIYKAETRELKEDEALDGGLDTAMNSLGKFLRKSDIEEVGGELQEFNKTRKLAVYTGTRFDSAKKQADTLNELGLSRDSVLDVLKREKDPALPKQKHTVAQRVKELPNLIESDTESAKLGIEWRKGIINAEIKYGETISDIAKAEKKDVLPRGWHSGIGLSYHPGRTKFAHEEPKDSGTQVAYQKFMKLLDKGVSNTKVERLSQEEIDKDNLDTIKKAKEYTPTAGIVHLPQLAENQEKIEQRIKDCTEYASEFGRHINGSLGTVKVDSFAVADTWGGIKKDKVYIKKIENNGAIPFAMSGAMNNGDNLYNVGTDPAATFDARSTAWHELSHVMEYEKKLSPLTWNYIDSRYNPVAKAVLKAIPEEIAVSQQIQEQGGHDFPYRYTAKEYLSPGDPTHRNSELVSTAVQMMTNPVNLHRAATIDREHLMFGLFAMDK